MIQFDPLNIHHRSFILWAALLRYKAFGGSIRSVEDPVIVSAYETITHTGDGKTNSIFNTTADTTNSVDKSQSQKSTKGKSQQQVSINDIKPIDNATKDNKKKPSDIIRRLSLWKQQQAQSSDAIEVVEKVVVVAVGNNSISPANVHTVDDNTSTANLIDSYITVATINQDILSSAITAHIPLHERAARLNDLVPEEFEKVSSV